MERETEALLYKTSATSSKTHAVEKDAKLTIETLDGATKEKVATAERDAALGALAIHDSPRGYTEQLEHWAWCIRNPDPENLPHCHPKVALGDAVIALTSNIAARKGQRIEFKKEWFDPDSDETPEGVKPDVSRYA